ATESDVLETQIKALAPTNPALAQSILNAHRDTIASAANYDALNRTVATGVAQHFERMAGSDLQGAMRAYRAQRDTLSPETQSQLDTFFVQRQTLEDSRALTDLNRRIALDDKMRRENAEKAGNGYVTQMLADPTKVDPSAIANDPNLKYE